MTDLPHTYVDEADNTLAITARPGPRLVTRTTIPTEDERDVTEHVASVTAPKGAEAVELARAVLAAAGDTGHVVMSEADMVAQEDAAANSAAWSMRERAAVAATDNTNDDYDIRRKIRALPLFPDEPARTPLTADTDA